MSTRRTFNKSLAIGVVATLTDLAMLWLAVTVLGIPEAVANVPALLAGVVVQFFGNKYVAFEDRSRDLVRQGAWFAAIECGALALNAGLFHLLAVVLGAHYLVARLVASALVYVGYSYPLWGRLFRASSRA
ncbi:MAG: GtrA family protein [Deltaproteobacteria bacterium]|nr:GtrA family protein [Deltaproteobacteria bacterium]